MSTCCPCCAFFLSFSWLQTFPFLMVCLHNFTLNNSGLRHWELSTQLCEEESLISLPRYHCDSFKILAAENFLILCTALRIYQSLQYYPIELVTESSIGHLLIYPWCRFRSHSPSYTRASLCADEMLEGKVVELLKILNLTVKFNTFNNSTASPPCIYFVKKRTRI